MRLILGIDFDNTLVSYDDVMHSSAVRLGLIDKDVPRSKQNIRDEIRHLPDGEMKWCKFQAFVYGECMNEARLMEGAKDFIELSKKRGIQVFIVSHKTKFAAADKKGIDLRQVALGWMNTHGFFDDEGLGLSPQDVYFEMTRKEKVERIKELGCTHFIDDLKEVFLEKTFPEGVEKILFAPQEDCHTSGDMKVFTSWGRIYEYFFR